MKGRVKRDEKGYLNKKDLFLHRPLYSSISFALCGGVILNPSFSSVPSFRPTTLRIFLSADSRDPVPFRNKSDQFGCNHSILEKRARYRINHYSMTPLCSFYLCERMCAQMCVCSTTRSQARTRSLVVHS